MPPMPQEYVAIVGNAPNVPPQAYLAVVDASGNVISGSYGPPGGRLTLASGGPVLTGSVVASAVVIYTAYQNDLVPIYNGTSWLMTQFTELTNTLANSSVGSAGPAAAVANSNYDLFVWNNAGTLALTRGPLWTSDTARTLAIVPVNGIQVNLLAITNGPAAGRGTYVGTVRTDAGGGTVSMNFGSSAAGGGAALLDVWNCYNRKRARASVRDTTAYGYTSATIRAADASNTNRCSLVVGLSEDPVSANFQLQVQTVPVALASLFLGIGIDSTTAYAADCRQGLFVASAAAISGGTLPTVYEGYPGLGFHFIQALEAGDGSNLNTFNVNPVGGLLVDAWC
jgi:hypothetical protein